MERPREGSYAAMKENGTRNIAETLVMKAVNIDVATMEKYEKMMERSGVTRRDKTITVVNEGKPPMRYDCGQKVHIKTM